MKKISLILFAALPMLLCVWLYGYSLRLTFTLDDVNNLQSVQATDGLSHWAGDRSFPYYRPMAFSIWKGLWQVESRPYAFYALNLFTFGLTGVLVGQLSGLRQPFAGLAGCAFVAFPFSYQAVLWVSSFFHISLAFWVALSLWAAGQKEKRWLVVMAALAGAFSHENGVLLGALALCYFYQKNWRASLPFWGISLLYLGLWLTVPRSVDTPMQARLVPNDFPILLHGLVYPFDALAQAFVRWRGEYALPNEQPAQAVWILLLLILPPLLLWRRQFIAGVAWYTLAILPSLLNFDSVYLLGSPRLMLLASVGACWFWGGILAELWQKGWGKGLALGLVALSLWASFPFLAARRYDSLLLADYFWSLDEVAQSIQEPSPQILLVNAPNYLAPLKQHFLLGSEGNFLLLDGGDYEGLYWANLNQAAPFANYAFERQTLKYFRGSFNANGQEFSPELLQSHSHIISTIYTETGFYPSLVKSPLELSGESVFFPEATITLRAAEAHWTGQALVIFSTWEQAAPQGVKRFLHIFCNGEFIAQRDGYIWNDLYPFGAWQAEETQSDRAEFRFEAGLDPACLQVFTGLYWEMSGERLGDAFPIRVKIENGR